MLQQIGLSSGAQGLISLYGEAAFAIVCTFWIIHEVKTLLKR